MKINSILLIVIFITAPVFILFQGCSENDTDVPLASTQAKFEFEVSEILVDTSQGIIHYEVKLFNKSIKAQSYYWDFGNGETSNLENPVVVYTAAGKYTITLTVTPAHELYYNKLTDSRSFAFGKQQLLFEDFSSGIDHLDDDSWAPEGWKIIDHDGDGYNWYVGMRQEVLSMRSQSWDTDPLTPDN